MRAMPKRFAIFAAAIVAGCEPGAGPAGKTAAPAPSEQTVPSEQPGNTIVEKPATTTPSKSPEPASPCLIQDGKRLDVKPLRAIGTEPFWGARIEGRCVTYSTPEDQAGTRIWTRFSGTAENGTWSGALGGRRFELKTSPDARCSDGMSDNIYPIAVALLVSGEERRGCAEPRK